MVVGICLITLFIHDSSSLKAKRMVVKSITDKVRNRFNVSIAEVDSNDVWQRAELGICAVGNEHAHINSVIDHVLNFIEGLYLAEIVDQSMELVNYKP